MGNGVSSGWAHEYQGLRNLHDEAYKLIEEAILLEEQEQKNDAVDKYKAGILTIDKALDVVITCPENPDQSWEDACRMVQKMKRTRAEVLIRINSITSSSDYIQHDPPPSYDDAMSSSSEGSLPRTYNELAVALDSMHVDTPEGTPEVIIRQDDVQMYLISPEGVVSAEEGSQVLQIVLIEDVDTGDGTAYLQVGTWVYPLVAGVSPCYRTSYGAFIFPDVHSDIPGSSIGIVVPQEVDTLVLELLENILHGVISETSAVELRTAKHRSRRYIPQPGLSGTISRGLVNGAYYIAKGLTFGAEKTGELINYSTPRIINKLTPAEAATPVPENVAKGFRFAENATKKTAEVTGFVAEKVGTATSKLAHFLAPHVQKQGTRLLSSGFNMSEQEASNNMNGILTVAAGAVEGFSTIYAGLETSASILGNNLKDNSVKIVKHKYGSPTGAVADETFNTVGNVINIYGNSKLFTPKGFLKRTAKDTGRALVEADIAGQNLNMPSTSRSTGVQITEIPNNSNDRNHRMQLYPDLNDDFNALMPGEKSLERKN